MQLDGEHVKRAMLLSRGLSLDLEECERRSRLLGTREELLANLIFVQRIFADWEDLTTEIRKIAGQYVSGDGSRNRPQDDIVLIEKNRKLTVDAIERLLKAERERVFVFDNVHNVMKERASIYSSDCSKTEYSWHIAHEPREI